MFGVGDQVVHPMHGAGLIEDMVERRIDGKIRVYFVMRMTYGSMTVMLPRDTLEAVGIRAIISREEADRLIDAFDSIEPVEDANWSKRHRENTLKIKSGDLYQVAGVVKGMLQRDKEKGLSTGERKLLSSARQILVSEITLAKNIPIDSAEALVNQMLA